MLAPNKQGTLQLILTPDRPQARRVTFSTANNNIFYLELAMDKTEFIQLEEFEIAEDECPDSILEALRKNARSEQTSTKLR